MEMQQVRYFLAVARTLNFTHAAEECHVAQPSLSRAIKNLEAELGGDLFRRERSLTHLTDLGGLMLPLLTRCHESALAAKTLAASYKNGGTAPLRLGLSHSMNLALFVPALTELVKVLPGIELQFFRGKPSDLAERLKSGASELAIAGPLGNAWERLDSWLLFEEGYSLVVHKTHPLALRDRVGFSEIAGVRLICRLGGEQADELGAILASHGVQPRGDDDIISDQDLTALLEANVGAAIIPQSVCGSGNLRLLAVDGLSLKLPVRLYAVAGRERTPAAAGLMKLLRAADWTTRSQLPSGATKNAKPRKAMGHTLDSAQAL